MRSSNQGSVDNSKQQCLQKLVTFNSFSSQMSLKWRSWMETQQNYPLGYRRNYMEVQESLEWIYGRFPSVDLSEAASLESPTLGIYYRDSKPVPITPIKWPYTVNQLGNHTGKKKHMHSLIKVSRYLLKSFYIRIGYRNNFVFLPCKFLYFECYTTVASSDGHISSLGYLDGLWVKCRESRKMFSFLCLIVHV